MGAAEATVFSVFSTLNLGAMASTTAILGAIKWAIAQISVSSVWTTIVGAAKWLWWALLV